VPREDQVNLPKLIAIPMQVKQVAVRSLSVVRNTIVGGARKCYNRLRGATRKANSLLAHIDVLSINGSINGKREAAQIVLIPAATFGVTSALAASAGVAHQRGCNVGTNFAYILFLQPKSSYHCPALPFLSDIPMVLLSFTCPFAFVLYRLVRRRLASIPNALTATGLLQDPALRAAASQAVHRLEQGIDHTKAWRVVLFVASACIATWLYSRDLIDGHLFNLLARTQADGRTNVSELHAAWWANYHAHPLLAAVCISIGSVGVYYAVQSGLLFLRIGLILTASRDSAVRKLNFSYVPTWRDRSYGWSPFTGALYLIYLAAINFAVSMVAIYDIVENRTWTIGVEAFFVTLGVAADLSLILGAFARMLAAHRGVADRLRDELVGVASGSLTSQRNATEQVIAAADLAAWRRIPVSNFGLSLLKLVPGALGLIEFVRTFFFLQH
jgi:hypothetical protein